MKNGILFDLDGTLWDSSRQVAEAWNIVLRRQPDMKQALSIEDIQGVMGMQMDAIAEKFFGHLPAHRKVEIMNECMEYENEYLLEHGGILFPQLEMVLQELSETYLLAIVSNCQEGYIEAFLEHHALDAYFTDFESYGNTELSKGENIKLVCERNALVHAIYLGDTQGDYEAACEAGIPFILAGYGFGNVAASVPVIDSLAALPEMVRQMLASMMSE